MSDVDGYPSVWWIAIPPVLLFTGYYIRKWYLARRLRVHGIGKGAPGFQTGVKKIRVTPEIAARIKRGEEVSPEEIAEAAAKAEKQETKGGGSVRNFLSDRPPLIERDERGGREKAEDSASESASANEWLPESITKPKRRGKARRG